MKYSEVRKDLFTLDDSYYLAHCIASDLIMGAGIAVLFQRKFSLRQQLIEAGPQDPGSCVLVKNVFNLITKSRSSGKPTYTTLGSSLQKMKKICNEMNIKKLAMPKIGCGLDRLQWPVVKDMILNLFKESEIEILVCKWR